VKILTARLRLTLLYAGLIALSGSAVTALIIVLSFTPVRDTDPADKATLVVKLPPKMIGEEKRALQEAEAAKAQARVELRSRLIGGAAVGVGVLTLLSGGLGWWVAGRVLRPVHTVSDTARRLSEQNLHERIPVSGPHDEMRELAETFNGMLARLQRSFDAQSRFAANASHELRGPMTTQRALVEVAAASPDASTDLRELAGELRPVLGRQERLVDGLLALAWSENGTSTIEPVRLDLLARTSLDRLTTGLTVSENLRPAAVTGDPVLLDLLVDNVIRNAVQHNVAGGRVWVTTGERTLTVENTGAPVEPDRLAELVEPFRRGDRDRTGTGTGLGLAIVMSVAETHGADVTLTPRSGGGIRLRVDFSRSDRSP
jgi:signal transduction histidine kinase